MRSGEHRATISWLLLAGIVAGIGLRWLFPEADPPLHRQTGAYWWEEVWSFGARNGALFGAWRQDEFHPWVACPWHTVLVQGALRVFGLNCFGLRFVAMLGGSLLIPLAYLQSRFAGFSRQAGLVAACALACSWAMAGHSKCMTIEPTLHLFFAASILFVLIGEGSSRYRLGAYGIAGLCGGLAILCKASALPMIAPIGVYILVGPVVNQNNRPWPWRTLRSTCYAVPMVTVCVVGYVLWIADDVETFRRLVIEVSLVERSDTSLFMRAYKAVTWLDSQAFLASPVLIAAVLVLLPGLHGSRASSSSGAPSPMRRFAAGLCLTSLVLGVLILVNVDVPARRLSYLNLFLAIMAGYLWDESRSSADCGGNTQAAFAASKSSLSRGIRFFCCVLAALVLVGWLLSPNGGAMSFLAPSFAAHVLFTMSTKIAYKAAWLGMGMAGACVLYRFWPMLWVRRSCLLRGAVALHLILFCIYSALWTFRLTHTVRDASRSLGEHLPEQARVLGADATSLGFLNTTCPLFWSPLREYYFANYDYKRIENAYHPKYMLVNDIDLAAMDSKEEGIDPFVSPFLKKEILRLPIYEIHGSTTLGSDVVLFRKTEP